MYKIKVTVYYIGASSSRSVYTKELEIPGVFSTILAAGKAAKAHAVDNYGVDILPGEKIFEVPFDVYDSLALYEAWASMNPAKFLEKLIVFYHLVSIEQKESND